MVRMNWQIRLLAITWYFIINWWGLWTKKYSFSILLPNVCCQLCGRYGIILAFGGRSWPPIPMRMISKSSTSACTSRTCTLLTSSSVVRDNSVLSIRWHQSRASAKGIPFRKRLDCNQICQMYKHNITHSLSLSLRKTFQFTCWSIW